MFLVELLGGTWLVLCMAVLVGTLTLCHGSMGHFLVHLYFGQFEKEAREPLHWELPFLFRMFFSYYLV